MSTIKSYRNPVTRLLSCIIGAALIMAAFGQPASAGPNVLPLQVSTVPGNGDLNPYGLAVVPDQFPGNTLHPGQLLVANFNNSQSQGMGSTIITVNPTNGKTGLFFQGIPPIGFTNALAVARAGFVFAGSVFTTDGTESTAKAGPLLVFDRNGGPVPVALGKAQKINGPWGLAINDQGETAQLFVSNVFDGTITRLDVSFKHGTVKVMGTPQTIASGYSFGLDPGAIVVGPAGLAYDSVKDVLYVAAEADNAIYALVGAGATTKNLGTGDLVSADSAVLAGPLGLILAPNGHLITANADPATVIANFNSTAGPSEIVEFTVSGKFVRTFSIDSTPGSAFAINVVPRDDGTINQFAYVDDSQSTLSILLLAQ
jgi:hypothetical protein